MPRYDENGNLLPESRPVPAMFARAAQEPQAIYDRLVGVAKGIGRSVVGAGEAVANIPYAPGAGRNVASLIDAGYSATGYPVNTLTSLAALKNDPLLVAQNPNQEQGMAVERVAEFLALPSGKGRILVNAAKIAAGAAGLTGIQGGSATDIRNAALIGGATAGVVPMVGRAVESWAVPMAKSAMKPTVTSLKQTSGASMLGLNETSRKLAQFVVDNRITTPEKAEAIIQSSEKELQRLLATKNTVTDAGARAARYLWTLRKNAKKQGIPADDVAILSTKIKQFLKSSPLTEDVVALDSSGNVILTASGAPKMTRAPRTDVMADEALATARATGKWATKKQYGEMKGAAIEADKAVERATRDAVKIAVPEAKPILAREGQAIQAKKTVDRMMTREGNRNPLDFPATIAFSGGKNWLGIGLQIWRNNTLRSAIGADMLGKALQNNDPASVLSLVSKAGMSIPSLANAGVVVDLDQPTEDGEWEQQASGKWRFIK